MASAVVLTCQLCEQTSTGREAGMKWLLTSLAVAMFSTVAIGQQIKLEGRLITDAGEPVPNTRVRVAGEQSVLTDAEGRFSIQLSTKLAAGKSALIIGEKKNWLINQPLDGEWTIPGLQYLQPLDVIVVPWGSKALWTNARIEKELKQQSAETAKPRSDSDGYIEEQAQKYGSPLQVPKEAFDKWANSQNEKGNIRIKIA